MPCTIARYGSPEYLCAPGDYPGGAYPPLPWTVPAPVQDRLAKSWDATVDAHQGLGYRELLDTVPVQLEALDPPARAAILGGNARRVYSLEARD